GVVVGLFIVYVDAFHDLSSAEGLILLAAYLSRVAAAPAALMFIRRLPRRTFWIASTLGNALLYVTLFFVQPGGAALTWLIAFAVAAGVIDCVIGILALMWLGDIIDDDAERTQRDKAASYKAAVNLVEKALRAMGLSGGLLLVGVGGLQVGETN